MSEDEQEREWAVIRTLFAGRRLINADNIKADTKGNKPMDEEVFPRVEVDIEVFTRAAMDMKVAVINAEAQMKDAKQQWIDAEKALRFARNQRIDAETTLVAARGKLRRHLEWVRGLNVTVPLPLGWEEKLGARDE